MKNKRQKKILELIAESVIETQDALSEKLVECGYACTQSTISRDIKQLHLVKAPCGDGRYRYAVSKKQIEFAFVDRLQKILRECCLTCNSVNNLAIIKTMPGLADAAGAALDSMEIPEMVGCVCGNDTVLIVMRDEASALELCREIAQVCK